MSTPVIVSNHFIETQAVVDDSARTLGLKFYATAQVQLKKVQPAKRNQQQHAPSSENLTDETAQHRTAAAPVKVKSPAHRHKRKLMQLREMGFGDDSFNRHLLDQFNGDITSVVNALVTHMSGLGGGDGPNAPLGSYVM